MGSIHKLKVPLSSWMVVTSSAQDIVSYFLPKGYPYSVRAGYGQYVAFQSGGAVFSSVASVLSIQSLLLAVGVGQDVLPVASTINWILKDGIGQLGGVFFASLVSNQFDSQPKRWRILASVSWDLATLLELLTPLFPGQFLVLASVANIGKNISFLSSSASRAAIHRSFAVHENLADLTVKTGSQSIISSMIGTALGIGIASFITETYHFSGVLTVFLICSMGHQVFNYWSLSHVTLSTLNIERLLYLYTHYMHTLSHSYLSSQCTTHCLLSSSALTSREVLHAVPKIYPLLLPSMHIGADVNIAIPCEEDLIFLRAEFQSQSYLVIPRANELTGVAETHLLFKDEARIEDVLKGILTAHMACMLLKEKGYRCFSLWERVLRGVYKVAGMNTPSRLRLQTDVLEEMRSQLLSADKQNRSQDSRLDIFVSDCLSSEWHAEELLLETRRARIRDI